jgi:soluble lytic murein transglycosylase-like protein
MLSSKFLKAFFISLSLLFIAAPAICYLQQKNAGILSQETMNAAVVSLKAKKAPLNKHAVKFVRQYLQKNNEDLFRIRQKSKSPFLVMDAVFKSYDLPVELKYLAVIESELKPTALSRVGAAGPWQLMPATAKILGLKITGRYDERTQYKKSTKAAARYLKDLYAEFGDWLLVLAAYNGGPGPVHNAIHKSGSRNFWNLQYYLPAESREHVKKFIATHYYFEGQGSQTTLTKDEALQFNKVKTKFLALQQQAIHTNPAAISANNEMGGEKAVAGRF